MKRLRALFLLLQLASLFCSQMQLASFASTQAMTNQKAKKSFDTIIRGGMVYDGTGGKPRRADVASLAIGSKRSATWPTPSG